MIANGMDTTTAVNFGCIQPGMPPISISIQIPVTRKPVATIISGTFTALESFASFSGRDTMIAALAR